MTCRECMRKRDTMSARRYGGGSYRRAAHGRMAQICEPCCMHLIETATTGHNLAAGWDVSSLRYAVEKFLSARARALDAPR